MKTVRLRDDAERELVEAAIWYDDEREGLGLEFTREVFRTLDQIAEGPGRFPVLKRGIRRALVERFPYGVFFVDLADDEVLVIGVIHLHRDPNVWETR